MKALRRIVDVKNQSLNIILPEDFIANKVEVIILPIEEPPLLNISGLRGKLNLSSQQYNDFQKFINDSRDEWERNI